MRAHEFLTEEQLDEINRRDFLKTAALTTMYAGLGVAAVDQGAPAEEPDEDEEDSDEAEQDE